MLLDVMVPARMLSSALSCCSRYPNVNIAGAGPVVSGDVITAFCLAMRMGSHCQILSHIGQACRLGTDVDAWRALSGWRTEHARDRHGP